MEIKVNRVEEFVVIPQQFKNEENPPKFKFRTPTSSDFLNYFFSGNVNTILYDCFIGFENKIKLTDTADNEIKYNTYQDFMTVGTAPQLNAIHIECANAMTEKLNAMNNEAIKTQKKSK